VSQSLHRADTMSESKTAPAPRRRGRRGRRGTVCAVPIKLEAGWKPRVVAKEEAERVRCVVKLARWVPGGGPTVAGVACGLTMLLVCSLQDP